MGQTDHRKYLLGILYKTIIKEIYPINVGNAFHADKINLFSKQRKLKGYQYDDYAYLGLHIDSAVHNFGFNCDISENNFHNWMQGIANPKYLVIINSILEYLIDTCKDIGKCELLRSRILMLLKSPEFNQYTGDLIPDIIQLWIDRIEANDTEMLYKATKEIMYLLKNKEKFIPYLLKEQNNLKTAPTSDLSEIKENADNPTLLPPTSSSSTLQVIESTVQRLLHSKKIVYPIAVGVLLIMFLFGELLLQKGLTSQTKGSDYNPSYAANSSQVTSGITAEGAMVKENTESSQPSYDTATIQESAPEVSSSDNMNNDAALVAADSFSTEDISLYSEPNASDESASDTTVLPNSDQNAVNTSSEVKQIVSGAEYDNTASTEYSNNQSASTPSSTPSAVNSPAIPVILSPANESVLKYSDVKVEWDAVANATGYNVMIANTSSWTTIYAEKNLNGTFLVLDKALFSFAGRYRIYVSTVIGEQISAPQYVDITFEGLCAPTIISPINDEILPVSDVTLSWKPVAYVTGYLLAVTNTTTWEPILSEQISPCSSYTLDHSLFLPGQSYRIYLTSEFDAAASEPSYIDIKIKELSSPEAIAPVNGDIISSDDLTLSWLPVPIASSYGVTITDTVSWENVYSRAEIAETTLQLDKNLFVPGRSYRIYLYCVSGDIYSVPNYIDITVSK